MTQSPTTISLDRILDRDAECDRSHFYSFLLFVDFIPIDLNYFK
ncbi:MAG: hypothetical protein ACRC62_26300 [Microcoleus sp.]